VRSLNSDFIDLGAAEDLDGDAVLITFEVSPATSLITFDAAMNIVDLSIEQLFELSSLDGPQTFEISLVASDTNVEPRSTEYWFKFKVPTLSPKDIGAYYAGLIYQRLSGATEDKEDADVPFITEVEITQTGQVFVYFSEALLTKSPQDITEDVVTLELTSKSESEELESDKDFTWTALAFKETVLKLQLDFESPWSISSRGKSNLDLIEVRIKNPFLFRSKTSFEMIPRGDSALASVPLQISEDQAE
jgi:hypothetical protein